MGALLLGCRTGPVIEVCNGEDDDGDLRIDEGTGGWVYVDSDGDGYGSGEGRADCQPDSGEVFLPGDCDDDDPDVFPGQVEPCTATTDLNCDGVVPWEDADEDGVAACQDCDDEDADVHPGADEHCDERDEDCDDAIDEGAVDQIPSYADLDGDGFAGADAPTWACDPEFAEALDCDDEEAAVNPDAVEVCEDGIDNDCDDRDAWCWLEGTLTKEDADLIWRSTEDYWIGAYVGTGDIDGDGEPEIAMGQRAGSTDDEWRIFLDLDPQAGDQSVEYADYLWTHDEDLSRFSREVFVTDLDGDGIDDLATYRSVRSGQAIHLLYGPITGTQEFLPDVTINEPEGSLCDPNAGYDEVFFPGDVSGDGIPELGYFCAVESDRYSFEAYEANVLFFSDPGDVTSGDDYDGRLFVEPAMMRRVEGLGDQNGDGYADLLYLYRKAYGGYGYVGTAFLVNGPITGELDEDDIDAQIVSPFRDRLNEARPVPRAWSRSGEVELMFAGGDHLFSEDWDGIFVTTGPYTGTTTISADELALVDTGESHAPGGWHSNALGDIDEDGWSDLVYYDNRGEWDGYNACATLVRGISAWSDLPATKEGLPRICDNDVNGSQTYSGGNLQWQEMGSADTSVHGLIGTFSFDYSGVSSFRDSSDDDVFVFLTPRE